MTDMKWQLRQLMDTADKDGQIARQIDRRNVKIVFTTKRQFEFFSTV